MVVQDSHETPKDPLNAAIEAFYKAWISGNPPDLDEFCRIHPEFGTELRTEIESLIYASEGLSDAGKFSEDVSNETPGAGDEASGKIIGDFRILREIGRGGMGVVYEAEQISLRRLVALKVLPTHLSVSDHAVKKFHREAEAGGRQTHPGIVSIFAVGEYEGIHYIAQELVEGSRTLADKLEEYREKNHLPLGYFREVADLIAKVVDALQQAHASGVIHRDIKPSNILITKEESPRVSDFGLARVEDALALSRTGEFAGTPYYMSPEQAASRRIGIDHRTDIFSLGVTLYEMLTLVRPFEGETSQEVLKKILLHDPRDPRKVNSRIPRDLAVISLKALEKKPEDRYQSMADFANDLKRFLNGEVILARPSGAVTKIMKRVKRSPALSAAMGFALMAVLVLIASIPWYVIRVTRAKKEAEEQERLAKARYENVTRLSDVQRLAQLRADADELWPAYPVNIEAMKQWLTRAEELVGRREEHFKMLMALRTGAMPFDDETLDGRTQKYAGQWFQDVLEDFINALAEFYNEETGMIRDMRNRLAFAETIEEKSITKHSEAWDRAIASISDKQECPIYKGLTIPRQIGLVPIGKSPDSGLWEFSHLQTGDRAERDPDRKIWMTEDTGLVFVLIPEGSFNMGARRPDENHPEGSPNVDPFAKDDEQPVHEVHIKSFFLSKYEMTLGQWFLFTRDLPTERLPGTIAYGRLHTLLYPVENITWDDAFRVLTRLGLRLSSEAEWEYAARAGTTTVWWTGNNMQTLVGTGNLAQDKMEWLTHDGYKQLGPVDLYRPNWFGLYNIYGNVTEWCQDQYHRDYGDAPIDGDPWEAGKGSVRIARGGWFGYTHENCRSATRDKYLRTRRGNILGVRPVRDIDL